MNELTVLGNEFLDIIDIVNYYGKYQRKIQAGGIWNITQGQKIALRHSIANIIVNKHGTDSACQHGKHIPVSIESAYKYEHNWCHLAYANICDIDFTQVKAKVKSCDLTKDWFVVDTNKVFANVECCDYVFLSSEDKHDALKNYLFKSGSKFSGWLIEHYSQGSVACQPKKIKDAAHLSGDTCGSDGINISHYWNQKENFLFTVGAGDRFAGYFIEHRMSNPESLIKNSQTYAHTEVLKWLREVNEKI